MVKITMSFSRVGRELSSRLSFLRSHYRDEHHIWDIGCDHGLLGLSFLDKPSVKSIHLIDPSELVINELRGKVGAYITKAKVLISQIEGQKIKIADKKNLIFMAGMGGEIIGEIIENILPQLDYHSRIVISPHRKILDLRLLLSRLPISLESENVIKENNQFYQILCLTPSEAPKIVSLYGDNLWDSSHGKEYLEHELSYIKHHRNLAAKAYEDYLKLTYAMKFSKDSI
jgi:tRNA (adenine22-N1)-methyltransferase